MSRPGLTSRIANSLSEASDQESKYIILQKYRQDRLIKRIVNFGYNPLVQFGMESFKPNYAGIPHGLGISKFLHILDEILAGKLDESSATFATNLALSHISDDESDILIQLLHKNLNWGLETETINRVWPDLIKNYPLQTPAKYTKTNYKKFEYPVAAQKISHGMRINIVVIHDDVTFRNKHGVLMPQFDVHAAQFRALAQNQRTVFDGHAVLIDADNNEVAALDEQILNSHPNNVRFILWDSIRYDGFADGKDTRIGYNWRFNGLEHMMFLAFDKNPNPVYGLPVHAVIKHASEVTTFSQDNDCDCIIKNLPGIWHSGETKDELIVTKEDAEKISSETSIVKQKTT
jgi:hypothetical protein|tara:strand:- start:3792 stop:4832 length:1041 start_codon:yes stop_codon:yes gene_type:complete